ncbi:cupin domain-containing protein [Hypericibacter sp.]|uniref:cupin domain-containing protein n=1 Tax=Hypericibacter sp. TaxID=2705401 RepID=UPI003D6CAECB
MNRVSKSTGRRMATAFALCAGLALAGAADVFAGSAGDRVTLVSSEALPDLPGQRLSTVLVEYEPGGKSISHHHAGSVMAYILEGSIRSQLKGGEVRVYHAGEVFFEPPGSEHLVSENASQTEPAKLLAIFVAPEGAELTVFDK